MWDLLLSSFKPSVFQVRPPALFLDWQISIWLPWYIENLRWPTSFSTRHVSCQTVPPTTLPSHFHISSAYPNLDLYRYSVPLNIIHNKFCARVRVLLPSARTELPDEFYCSQLCQGCGKIRNCSRCRQYYQRLRSSPPACSCDLEATAVVPEEDWCNHDFHDGLLVSRFRSSAITYQETCLKSSKRLCHYYLRSIL